MTGATTEKLIGQLRVLHQLTISESQVAQSRQVQARNDKVRQQFTANAADAQQRAKLIRATLRELGGVPDVIAPALGRAAALVKTVVEHGQPLTGTLFADLALERQLLDRARYLEVLAGAAGHVDSRLLAQRLQVAHRDTIEWIIAVLAEEACGKPAALQPTPVQKALGRLASAANYPPRWATARINEAAAAVARTRSRVAAATDAGIDSFTLGRDDELHEAELTADPDLYFGLDLTINEVEEAVHKLSDRAPLDILLRYVVSDPAALDALRRYARNHRDRAGASSDIENQSAEVHMRAGNGN